MDASDCCVDLIDCKKQLKAEDAFWEQEFECDEWAETGVTLYRHERPCETWILTNLFGWEIRYFDKSINNDVSIYKYHEQCRQQRNQSACDIDDNLRILQEKEICTQVPYQEEVCVHKKLVGLKQ